MTLVLISDIKAQKPTVKHLVTYRLDDVELNDCVVDIKRQLKQQKIKRLPCYCVLEDGYHLFLMDKLNVPAVELRDAMRWKVKDLIDYDCDEAVIDVFDKPETDRSYVVATNKQGINSLVTFVHSIGLELKKIDIAELTLKRFFQVYSECNLAIAMIHNAIGKVLILKNQQVYFSRQFLLDENDDLASNVVLELQRSLDYYERQMRQIPPPHMVFLGDVNHDFVEEVGQQVSQKVTLLDINESEIPFLADGDQSLDYMSILAIGAASP